MAVQQHIGSAISSINNSAQLNSVCIEPYLFLWGTGPVLTPTHEDQETKPAMFDCLSQLLENGGPAAQSSLGNVI